MFKLLIFSSYFDNYREVKTLELKIFVLFYKVTYKIRFHGLLILLPARPVSPELSNYTMCIRAARYLYLGSIFCKLETGTQLAKKCAKLRGDVSLAVRIFI